MDLIEFLLFLLIRADAVLHDVLVIDLVIELEWVLLYNVIVDLSTLGLNDVALLRRWAVSQTVVTLVNATFHGQLMVILGFFVIHKSSGRRRVLISAIALVLLIPDFIEA